MQDRGPRQGRKDRLVLPEGVLLPPARSRQNDVRPPKVAGQRGRAPMHRNELMAVGVDQ